MRRLLTLTAAGSLLAADAAVLTPSDLAGAEPACSTVEQLTVTTGANPGTTGAGALNPGVDLT